MGSDSITYAEFVANALRLTFRPVELYYYDLSKSFASVLSPVLLGQYEEGIWHTSVGVFDQEPCVSEYLVVCGMSPHEGRIRDFRGCFVPAVNYLGAQSAQSSKTEANSIMRHNARERERERASEKKKKREGREANSAGARGCTGYVNRP